MSYHGDNIHVCVIVCRYSDRFSASNFSSESSSGRSCFYTVKSFSECKEKLPKSRVKTVNCAVNEIVFSNRFYLIVHNSYSYWYGKLEMFTNYHQLRCPFPLSYSRGANGRRTNFHCRYQTDFCCIISDSKQCYVYLKKNTFSLKTFTVSCLSFRRRPLFLNLHRYHSKFHFLKTFMHVCLLSVIEYLKCYKNLEFLKVE